jgi:pyrimidine oxygenase
MQIGVFVPTLSGGWLITPARKPCEPSYDFLRQVVQRAEHYGMEFALSPVKFKGFGGPSEFWDRGMEAITLTAGLAAATTRIRLFASIATLTIHPAITARMAATIDSVSHGRFGLNIVSGWSAAEYKQMGLWPGEEHYKRRYEYTTEYVRIMRELWEKGRSDFSGEFFKLEDCVLAPRPQSRIELVCAGQSDRGMAFCADYGDYMFCVGTGVNKPDSHRDITRRLQQAAQARGRNVGALLIIMIIAEETEEAAFAKWRHYNETVDRVAIANVFGQASADTGAGRESSTRALAAEVKDAAPVPEGAVNLNFATLVGSFASVAAMLDEAGAVPGTDGVMLIFDDYADGLENFGNKIQPLMQSRSAVLTDLAAAQ